MPEETLARHRRQISGAVHPGSLQVKTQTEVQVAEEISGPVIGTAAGKNVKDKKNTRAGGDSS